MAHGTCPYVGIGGHAGQGGFGIPSRAWGLLADQVTSIEIVTADGQYWFAGALLPTGHRLVSVGKGEVRFERDGLVESLRVAPSVGQPSADPNAQPTAPPANLASQPNTTAATSLFSNAG